MKAKLLMFKYTYITDGTLSAIFKGSLTCRLSYCMWACVTAAVHIVTNCLCLQQVRTADLGGYATSDEFTRAVIANLGN